jgi:hypothetical protein
MFFRGVDRRASSRVLSSRERVSNSVEEQLHLNYLGMNRGRQVT